MIKLKELILEAKNSMKKLKRDVFIYLDPKGDKDKFAQCSTCALWTGDRCSILGEDVKITADMSCNFYVNGEKNPDQPVKKLHTPKEAGLVTRQVRCENCRSFSDGKCMLYEALNKLEMFDLDTKVNPKGCCNAQMPK